jgi:hypothetical protein
MRVNLNVSSIDPAQIVKLLNKGCEPPPVLGVLGGRCQYGYAARAFILLRARS